MELLYKIVITALASLGFALFFNVRARHLLKATIGGVLTWLIYYGLTFIFPDIFIPCLIASVFAAIYSEAIARLVKAPATVFSIISVIPLVPGRGLYYTMYSAVSANWAECSEYALSTFEFIAGIAVGICIVTAFTQTWSTAKERLKRTTES